MNKLVREKIQAQKKLLSSVPLLQELYDAVNDSVVILNKERQIVFANQSFKKFSKIKTSRSLFGLRLGEVLGCINAFKTKEGCGGSEFCAVCGILNSLLKSQKKKIVERETRISGQDNNAYILLVKATPLKLEKDDLTIFTIKDISHEKRRRTLEKIFFHDILNTITSLRLVSESLRSNRLKDADKIKKLILESIEDLTKSITGQKMLTEAEDNELSVHPTKISARGVVEILLDRYARMAAQNGVRLEADPEAEDIPFTSDAHILLRVLENMTKNAIEASEVKNKVTLGVKTVDNYVHFWIHNETVMPKKTKLQIFQRSFSTKAGGHGLGTYSMKLLSERYLKGQITFTSEKGQGTTFTAIYPKKL